MHKKVFVFFSTNSCKDTKRFLFSFELLVAKILQILSGHLDSVRKDRLVRVSFIWLLDLPRIVTIFSLLPSFKIEQKNKMQP